MSNKELDKDIRLDQLATQFLEKMRKEKLTFHDLKVVCNKMRKKAAVSAKL